MNNYPKKEKTVDEEGIARLISFSTLTASPDGWVFLDKYHILTQRTNLWYDKDRGMIVFKFEDTIQGKAIDPKQEPKCHTYSWNGKPYIAYHTTKGFINEGKQDRTSNLLIVEDPCSAARASEVIDSMALLGTEWHESYRPYLKGYSKVLIALDRTATDKAVGLMDVLALDVPVSLVILDKDVKDLSLDDLKELVTHKETVFDDSRSISEEIVEGLEEAIDWVNGISNRNDQPPWED